MSVDVAGRPERAAGQSQSAASRWRDLDYANFKRKVRAGLGIDLDSYKPVQMRRRLHSLMERSGARSFTEFFRLLERDETKRQEFETFLTINVSEFFRNPEKFQDLAELVLPELLKSRRGLRVWSAGCSYGAEPFSVAMLLHQLAPRAQHYLLATDVDDQVLRRAQAADSFTDQDVRSLPPGYLERYFTAMPGGRWALDPTIQARVTFRTHDLLQEDFEGDFDLILCRNVAIYFTDDAKDRLYRGLYGALRPGGYLFVGATEIALPAPGLELSAPFLGFYRKDPIRQ